MLLLQRFIFMNLILLEKLALSKMTLQSLIDKFDIFLKIFFLRITKETCPFYLIKLVDYLIKLDELRETIFSRSRVSTAGDASLKIWSYSSCCFLSSKRERGGKKTARIVRPNFERGTSC